MAEVAVEHVYSYPFVSAASTGPRGLRLAIATSGGEADQEPIFYRGGLAAPLLAARLLLAVSGVAATRFYVPPGMLQRILLAADPIVLSDGERLRFDARRLTSSFAGARVHRMRTVIACGVVAVLVSAPAAMAAKSRPFTAAYSGSAAGAVSGAGASGSATLSGRGRLIGASTLSGSGNGTFTDPACVLFDGSGVLKGAGGSITLAARKGHACAATSAVSFSGQATVTAGTARFEGARGTLTYTGSYNRSTGIARVSFRGRIRY